MMNPIFEEILKKQRAAEKSARHRERVKNNPELRDRQAAYEREKYLRRKQRIHSLPAAKAKMTEYYREAKRRQRGSVVRCNVGSTPSNSTTVRRSARHLKPSIKTCENSEIQVEEQSSSHNAESILVTPDIVYAFHECDGITQDVIKNNPPIQQQDDSDGIDNETNQPRRDLSSPAGFMAEPEKMKTSFRQIQEQPSSQRIIGNEEETLLECPDIDYQFHEYDGIFRDDSDGIDKETNQLRRDLPSTAGFTVEPEKMKTPFRQIQNVEPRFSKRTRNMNEHVKVFLQNGGKRTKRKNNRNDSENQPEVHAQSTEHSRVVVNKTKRFKANQVPLPRVQEDNRQLQTENARLKRQKTQSTKLGPAFVVNKPKIFKASQMPLFRLQEENKRLKTENKRLKRQRNMYKKRWTRVLQQLRKKERDNTPVNEVRKFLGERQVAKDIEEKLIEHAVLEHQLKQNKKSLKRYRDKDVLRRIFYGGNIAKKYRKMNYFKNFAPQRPRLSSMKKCGSLDYAKKCARPKTVQMCDDVKAFLERESSSRMTSGKSETITKNKIKKQRRYLLKSMHELHEEFLETVPYKISYTGFTKLRPFWILFPSVDNRDTCACKRHENMKLILKKLFYEKILPDLSSKTLLNDLTCNTENGACMLRKCLNCKDKKPKLQEHDSEKTITYFQWQTVNETYTEKKKGPDGQEKTVTKTVKKTKKKEICSTVQDLLNELDKELPAFMKHVYYMTHQFEVLRQKRENLEKSDYYFWVDWAENWNGKYAKEPQSLHFGGSREQFSLHTGVKYTEDKKQCFCTISDCRDHGPAEITAHLIPVLQTTLQPLPDLAHVHFQSDSPVTQYRGKEMFAFMVEIMPELCTSMQTMTWNYTEAGHGKGPVDGVGSSLKTNADKEVAFGNDVDTLQKFFECSKKLTNIETEIVTKDAIEFMRQMKIHPKTFPGTMNVHQVTWTRSAPHILQFNYLSCFICPPGTKCTHYHLGILDFAPKDDMPVQEQQIDDPLEYSPDIIHPASNPEKQIEKHDWVSVKLSGSLYPGLVLSRKGDTIGVKLMMRVDEEAEMFSWPTRKDVRKFLVTNVNRLNAPQETSPSMFKFIF